MLPGRVVIGQAREDRLDGAGIGRAFQHPTLPRREQPSLAPGTAQWQAALEGAGRGVAGLVPPRGARVQANSSGTPSSISSTTAMRRWVRPENSGVKWRPARVATTTTGSA